MVAGSCRWSPVFVDGSKEMVRLSIQGGMLEIEKNKWLCVLNMLKTLMDINDVGLGLLGFIFKRLKNSYKRVL